MSFVVDTTCLNLAPIPYWRISEKPWHLGWSERRGFWGVAPFSVRAHQGRTPLRITYTRPVDCHQLLNHWTTELSNRNYPNLEVHSVIFIYKNLLFLSTSRLMVCQSGCAHGMVMSSIPVFWLFIFKILFFNFIMGSILVNLDI